MQLLVSLGAALPLEQPRLSWAASLGCGHFLGLLFRLLARDQTEVTSTEPPGEENPPPAAASSQTTRPRARSCQTERMKAKRRKHLGLSLHSTTNPTSSTSDSRTHVSPSSGPAPRGHVLAEAAATLDTVCADYIASVKYEEVDTQHIL